MTAGDRWDRVRDLFERAIEREPGEVQGWLARETAGDRDLQREVQSLLDHHTRVGSFLAEPAGTHLGDLLSEPSLVPGQVVGPYTIVREIGRGGMGRVYLASDTRLQRPVALKSIPSDLAADASQRARLRREARLASALTHPGICTIYAFEEIDGALFIAAEYVDGHTLRQEIDSGRRPDTAEVVRTARELAAAVAHAHRHGVIHGDLKPANVMRTRDGHVKVLDFGLARTADPARDDGSVTQPGAIVGTPAYMSPERLNGHPPDMRGDVFAFGVTLSEWVSGLHPFDAPTSVAVAARILRDEPTPIEEGGPAVPPSIAAVVERCLRKAPGERFESAVAVADALATRDAAPPRRPMARWWQTHQVVAIVMYAVGCGLAWQVKEWRPGVTTAVFLAAGVAATVAGVFRGHLMFTHRLNGAGLESERRRAAPVTLAMDLVLALALVADGLLVSGDRPLAALMAFALGAGIAMARLVVEPSTTAASFERPHPR